MSEGRDGDTLDDTPAVDDAETNLDDADLIIDADDGYEASLLDDSLLAELAVADVDDDEPGPGEVEPCAFTVDCDDVALADADGEDVQDDDQIASASSPLPLSSANDKQTSTQPYTQDLTTSASAASLLLSSPCRRAAAAKVAETQTTEPPTPANETAPPSPVVSPSGKTKKLLPDDHQKPSGSTAHAAVFEKCIVSIKEKLVEPLTSHKSHAGDKGRKDSKPKADQKQPVATASCAVEIKKEQIGQATTSSKVSVVNKPDKARQDSGAKTVKSPPVTTAKCTVKEESSTTEVIVTDLSEKVEPLTSATVTVDVSDIGGADKSPTVTIANNNDDDNDDEEDVDTPGTDGSRMPLIVAATVSPEKVNPVEPAAAAQKAKPKHVYTAADVVTADDENGAVVKDIPGVDGASPVAAAPGSGQTPRRPRAVDLFRLNFENSNRHGNNPTTRAKNYFQNKLSAAKCNCL